MTIPWNELKALLDRHQRFMLTSHMRPDCDALGSELGLATLLEAIGKDVLIVNGDPTPPRLAFIDPEQRIRVLHDGVAPEQLQSIEVIIVVDTSAWGQLGPMGDVLRGTTARIAVIDHHASDGELDATVLCKDEHAEATGRLIVELAHYLDVSLTPQMAQPLFAALATDTGWFRFPSTSSHTYRVAAELMDAGAQPHAIYRHLYEQDSLNRAKLRGLALDHLTIHHGGRLASTYLLTEDFAETGARRSDTEDFINMALAVAGTQVAVMFSEQPRGTFKLSFRSRPGVDCSHIAAQFGGGGHRAAAGAMADGPFETVRTRVLDAVRVAIDAAERGE